MRACLDAGIAALEDRDAEAVVLHEGALETFEDVGAVLDLVLAHLDRVAVAQDSTEAHRHADRARPLIAQLGATALRDRLEELLARSFPVVPVEGATSAHRVRA